MECLDRQLQYMVIWILTFFNNDNCFSVKDLHDENNPPRECPVALTLNLRTKREGKTPTGNVLNSFEKKQTKIFSDVHKEKLVLAAIQ